MDNEYNYACGCCGDNVSSSLPPDNTIDGDVCTDCFNHHYNYCDGCDDYVQDCNCFECRECGETRPDRDYWRNSICYYCQDEFTHCYVCDTTYHSDNGHCNCYGRIRNYGYKPTPIFYPPRDYGNNNLYMGVELEVEIDRGYASGCYDIFGDKTYYKEDCSIRNGFEIVSHPATLEYHKNEMQWDDALEYLTDNGGSSHDNGRCGLHVHVNRDYFGDWDESKLAAAKIIILLDNCWNEIVKFTRRESHSFESSGYSYKPTVPKRIDTLSQQERYKGYDLDAIYSHWSRSRGALNVDNDYTLEFRIFRGTLNYRTFIATLELVAHICDIAKHTSLQGIVNMTPINLFSEYLTSDYSHLNEYAKSRFINAAHVTEIQF